ncbi:MAG: inositol monophosphatase family protein, partial [Gammaproteobacteria bacterium]
MVTQLEARWFSELLQIAKVAATHAGAKLWEIRREGQEQHGFDSTWPREIKAKADKVIEEIIINELIPTGVPILSEEAGEVGSYDEEGLRFIIDPIDGTANFVRGVGDSSISIALFKKEKPLFGVLYLFPKGQLAWGGPSIG